MGGQFMSLAGNGILAAVTADGYKSPPPLPFPKSDSDRLAARAQDDELVARCREGDLSAFEAIYRRHSPSLYNLAYRMVGHANDAEDLLQEIFLLAYNKLPGYQGQAALGTWLYRVATNRCLDHLRSRAARNQAVTDSLDAKDRPLSGAPVESTPERLDLERSVDKLPDSYRAAFLLYDVEGFEHKEVAEILGVAEGTSKSLVHKARLKIREHLGQFRGGTRQ
jgi:RNA polymerase sigma-70 factor (ECF subfamily)